MRGRINLVLRVIATLMYVVVGGLMTYLCIALLKGAIINLSGLISIISVIGIPLVIGTVLYIISMEEKEKRYKIVKIVTWLIFIIYIIILVSLLFVGRRNSYLGMFSEVPFSDYIKYNVNIIPFSTLIEYFNHFINGTMNKSTIFENIIGNVLVFAPMGIFLPCLFHRMGKWKFYIVSMLIILFSVEIIQSVLRCGISDIDDVILNLLGAVVTYSIWKTKVVQNIFMRMYVIKVV